MKELNNKELYEIEWDSVELERRTDELIGRVDGLLDEEEEDEDSL